MDLPDSHPFADMVKGQNPTLPPDVTTDDILKAAISQSTLQQQLGKVDSEGGVLIQPIPEFVVKTRDTNNRMKVFLNICSSEFVEAVQPQAMDAAQGLGDEETAVRVPMSIGPRRDDFDNRNEPCSVYDVVVAVETAARTKPKEDGGPLEGREALALKQVLVEMSMAAVERKFSIQLDHSDFSLPKMKYKGTFVDIQRVRAPRPKIEELDQRQEAEPVNDSSGFSSSGAGGGVGPDGRIRFAPDFDFLFVPPATARDVGLKEFCHSWSAGRTPGAWGVLDGFGLRLYSSGHEGDGMMKKAFLLGENERRELKKKLSAKVEEETRDLPIITDTILRVLVRYHKADDDDGHGQHDAEALHPGVHVKVSAECIRVEHSSVDDPLSPFAVGDLTIWFPENLESSVVFARAIWVPSSFVLAIDVPTSKSVALAMCSSE